MNKIRVELHKNLALINDEKESYAGISRHQNPRNSWCTFIQRELTSRYLKEQYFISRTKLEGVGISQVPRPYQLTFIPTCAMLPDPFFQQLWPPLCRFLIKCKNVLKLVISWCLQVAITGASTYWFYLSLPYGTIAFCPVSKSGLISWKVSFFTKSWRLTSLHTLNFFFATLTGLECDLIEYLTVYLHIYVLALFSRSIFPE